MNYPLKSLENLEAVRFDRDQAEAILEEIHGAKADLASKQDLEALDAKLTKQIGELRGDVGDLRGDVRELRGELNSKTGELNSKIGELHGKISEVRGDVKNLSTELGAQISQAETRHTKQMAAYFVALVIIMLGAIRYLPPVLPPVG